MKARIEVNGVLEVQRRGKWAPEYCPFEHNWKTRCGDWCPLFQEEWMDNMKYAETNTDGCYPKVTLLCGSGRSAFRVVGDARPEVVEAT